jgi:hypothetical protein
MQRRTPIFIVTSSRPRVGKTLIARAMVEYFRVQNRPVSAFDVNPDEFSLLDHLPAYTAAASIRDTRGEMALFDQLVLDDGVPKVVDLGQALFERFFAVLQPMVLFVADPDERARQGYAALNTRFGELALVPVFNEAVPMVARYCDHFPPSRRGGLPVVVPALTPVVRAVVERRGFSFFAYAAKTTDTTTELYSWIRRVFLTFRELEVRLLLGELKQPPRLQHSA